MSYILAGDIPTGPLFVSCLPDQRLNNKEQRGNYTTTGLQTSQLELGQENTSLLLNFSNCFRDGSSSDGAVVVDLCPPAKLAHRQARRSVFAKCSHLW